MIVNQTGLAAIFGVSEVTIWEWRKAGMPRLSQGQAGTAHQYETAACIAWYAEREASRATRESQKDKLTRLQADLLEIENAERRSRLVPGDEVEPLWRSRVFAAAVLLHHEPQRLAELVDVALGMEAKRTVLRREFNALLTHLGEHGDAMHDIVDQLADQDAARGRGPLGESREP